MAIIGLLIPLAAVGILASQDAPKRTPKQGVAKTDSGSEGQKKPQGQNGDQGTPRAVPASPQPTSPSCDESCQQARENLQVQHRLTWFTGLLVVVGAFQVATMIWQAWLLKQTRGDVHEQAGWMKAQVGHMKDQTEILGKSVAAAQKSADAADKSANALTNSERAWLLVEKVWLGSDPDRPSKETIPWGELVIRCEAKNYGRTPARVLDVRAMIEFGSTNNPSQIPLDGRINETGNVFTPRWVVLPDRKQTFHALQFDSSRPDEELRVTGSTGILFIHGIIEYWDMFSETKRSTRFCFRSAAQRDNPRPGEDFIREGADHYNQQT